MTSEPSLPTAPSASPELLRALSQPDLRLAAKTFARERLGNVAPAEPAEPADAAGAEVTDQLREHTEAAHGELRWQAFLASTGTPTQIAAGIAPGVHASLQQATLGSAQDSVSANRGQISSSFAADGSTSLGIGQNFAASSLSVSHNFGGPAAASLGASVFAGGKVKGLAASSSLTPGGLGQTIGLSASLVAVTDNSIEVLGAQRTTEGGTVERLTRLKSEFMPVLNVAASTAAAHVSVGASLSVFGGHSGTMEKFVDTDKLAAMLRQRDVWYRPALETAAALGLKVGFKLTPAAKLADEVVRGGGLEVGESYAFTRQKGLTFGISLGVSGIKGTVNVTSQSGSAFSLQRVEDNIYELAVSPSQVRAVSGGVDASVLAELSTTYSKAFVQRRVWHFDASRPEARAALAQAIDGRLPGTVEPLRQVSAEGIAALRDRQRDESLPPGVTDVLTELGQQTEEAANLASLRPLASTGLVAGLGLGKSGYRGTHGVAVGGDSGILMSHTLGSRRSNERLLGGAGVESVSTTVRELKDGQAAAALAELEIAVDFELRGAIGAGRAPVTNLAGKLAQTKLGSNTGARRSDLYHMQGRWTLTAQDLQALPLTDRQTLQEAAARSGVPAPLLRDLTRDIARAQASSAGAGDPHLAMAHTLASFVKSGRSKAVVALKHMLGPSASHEMQFGVTNARHERTISKFLRADTLQKGAKTVADAAKAAKAMGSLTKRAARQIAEISGDALLSGLMPQEQTQAVKLLEALRDSAAASQRGLLDGLPKKR